MGRLPIGTGRLLPGTIRGRILLLLLVVLIPILLLQLGVYYSRWQERRSAELQSNLEVGRAVAATFDEYIQDVLHQELAIGLAFTSPYTLSGDDGNRYLIVNAKDYPTVRDLAWLSPQGRIVASSAPQSVGMDVGQLAYYQGIAAGQEWSVSDLLLDPITGEPSFVTARGIRSATGMLQGVVIASVDAPHLDRLFVLERAGQGAFEIIDRQGRLVYRSPQVPLTWTQRSLGDDPMTRAGLAGKEVMGTFLGPTDGQAQMGAGTPIRSVGWVARAGRPETEVNAEILRDLGRDSLLLLLVALGAMFGAVLLSRSITTPVDRVRQYASSVGSGGSVQPAERGGPREVDELAATLSHMAEQIRTREQLLKGEVAALDDANLALRDAQQRLLEEREQERKALARELHDEVIQDLLGFQYQLESIAADLTTGDGELSEVRENVRALIDDVRRICTDLRPPTIDNLGLGAAIQSYVRDWCARTHIGRELDLDPNLVRLPEAVELSIFRIVQEGLANVWKHSGATEVCLGLRCAPTGSLLLSIADNGRGMSSEWKPSEFAARGHYGLLGINERVTLLGGHLQIRNQPSGGLVLEADIPIG